LTPFSFARAGEAVRATSERLAVGVAVERLAGFRACFRFVVAGAV
jgi:hypothetical protein